MHLSAVCWPTHILVSCAAPCRQATMLGEMPWSAVRAGGYCVAGHSSTCRGFGAGSQPKGKRRARMRGPRALFWLIARVCFAVDHVQSAVHAQVVLSVHGSFVAGLLCWFRIVPSHLYCPPPNIGRRLQSIQFPPSESLTQHVHWMLQSSRRLALVPFLSARQCHDTGVSVLARLKWRTR